MNPAKRGQKGPIDTQMGKPQGDMNRHANRGAPRKSKGRGRSRY